QRFAIVAAELFADDTLAAEALNDMNQQWMGEQPRFEDSHVLDNSDATAAVLIATHVVRWDELAIPNFISLTNLAAAAVAETFVPRGWEIDGGPWWEVRRREFSRQAPL